MSVQGGVQTTGDMARLLEDGVNAVANQDYEELSKEYEEMYSVESSDKAYETDVPVTNLSTATQKPEGNGITYDTSSELNSKIYKHVTYALGTIITEEAIEDNRYLQLMPKAGRDLKRSLNEAKELVAANHFNNGYSAALSNMWDGKALFANDHLLGGGGTQSNVLPTAADLSEAALEDMMIAIKKLVDDKGLLIQARAQTLFLPPELCFVAERILKSILQSGTANNDINALKNMGFLPGGYKVINRLNNPKNWWVDTNVPEGNKFFMRRGDTFKADGDFNTGNYRHKGTCRFSLGTTDYRANYGSGQVV